MFIKDGELLIRNAEPSDAEQLAAWWNDGKVMAHAGFPNGVGTTPEQVRKLLESDTDSSRRCIIELDGVPIGEMNYRDIGGKTAQIGIKICDFSKQNRGFGTQLLKMFIRELFSTYGFEKIALDTNLKNTRAQHVYEKLGFRKVKVEYSSWKNRLGELRSQVYYELCRDEWRFD